jgi:hypothetical protein
MKKLLIALAFLLSFNLVNAQDWFTLEAYEESVPATLTTAKGRTFEANVFIHNPWSLARQISVAHPDIQKEGKKEKYRFYKVGTFSEFSFNGLKFKLKKTPYKANVLVLIEGKASYYEFYEEVDNKRNVVHFIEVNDKLMPTSDVRLARFKKGGAKLFGDCKVVADKIASGEYGIDDIETIIKEYNELQK